MTPEEVRQYVAASRRHQGCPEHVQDPAAVAKVARLLRAVESSSRRQEGRAA